MCTGFQNPRIGLSGLTFGLNSVGVSFGQVKK
jgi:hypothetical protein